MFEIPNKLTITKSASYLLVLLLFGITSEQVDAQTCCSAGAPVSSSFDLRSDGSKKLNLQFEYNFKDIDRLVSENEVLENDPRTRQGSSLLFKAAYGLNKNWSLGILLPIVFQTRSTFSEKQSTAGVGDLLLVGQRSQELSNGYSTSFVLGVKVPTGISSHQDDRNIFLSPDMQSGSGSFDYLARIMLQKQNWLFRNFSSSVAFTYRYNSTNPDFGSENGGDGRSFKFGNEWIAQTQFNYQFVLGTTFLLPDIGLKLRKSSANEEQKSESPNSGGYWLNLPLGMTLNPGLKNFQVRAFAELPLYQELSGIQISTSLELGIEFSVDLNFKKEPSISKP